MKTKKHKKKKAGKPNANGEFTKPNGIHTEPGHDRDDAEGEDQDSRTPIEPPSSSQKIESDNSQFLTNGTSKEVGDEPERLSGLTIVDERTVEEGLSDSKDASVVEDKPANDSSTTSLPESNVDYRALTEERDALREEIAQVRRTLIATQKEHEQEVDSMREQLAASRSEKEQAEAQYRGLLGKVSTIRSQLGERLKADAVSISQPPSDLLLTSHQEDLSKARSRIEELEEQCMNLHEQNESRAAELATMAEEGEQRSKELSSLRNRTTLSQQNWSKEREDLIQRETYAKEEFEAAKQAMQDWEILAMEERSIRESIAERMADLEEQIANHREAYEKAASERDSQSLTVDGLQRALQEIQDGIISSFPYSHWLTNFRSSKA